MRHLREGGWRDLGKELGRSRVLGDVDTNLGRHYVKRWDKQVALGEVKGGGRDVREG